MDGLEGKRRLFCTLAGAIFGLGWLIFVDEIVHFNACWDRVTEGDPCQWGTPNTTVTVLQNEGDGLHRRVGFLEIDETLVSNQWSETFKWQASEWVSIEPFQAPLQTTPPPPTHRKGGWHDLSGSYELIYVPGALACISLFFVNTIDARHLSTEAEWIYGASTVALRVWLFFGLLIGLGSVVVACWVHLDLFTRHEDIKDEPGIAGIIQVLLLMISSLLFWIARSIGVDDELTDPFL